MDSELSFSPAAERNQQPILDALVRLLPVEAAVLEIASGTGQHAAHFAAARPGWRWQPSDADAALRLDIAARCAGLTNVRPPLQLDVEAEPWPASLTRFDAAYCANLLHIAPWSACPALMRGVAPRLAAGGVLLLYGPFLEHGEPIAPGNLVFDADLRGRDPRWGLRRLADVAAEAQRAGLALEQRLAMPANNLLLVLRAQ